MSVEMPRAASSSANPDRYMCSLEESSPFHTMTHGTVRPPPPPPLPLPPDEASLKYAGSEVPSYGTSTRVVAGSASAIDLASRSRQRW
jgi:hypothetical protein